LKLESASIPPRSHSKDAMADVVNGAGAPHIGASRRRVVCGKTGTAQAVGANIAPVGESEAENDRPRAV